MYSVPENTPAIHATTTHDHTIPAVTRETYEPSEAVLWAEQQAYEDGRSGAVIDEGDVLSPIEWAAFERGRGCTEGRTTES